MLRFLAATAAVVWVLFVREGIYNNCEVAHPQRLQFARNSVQLCIFRLFIIPTLQVSLSVSLMLTALEIWFQPQVKELAVLKLRKVSLTTMELLVFHAEVSC